MAEPYLGEIRIFPYNLVPNGWVACEGQILQINQNQALFSLLGNVYGGDGKSTFALPDLRGRVPVNYGSGIPLGQRGGEETHTLTMSEMPVHVHLVNASSTPATVRTVAGSTWADADNCYGMVPSVQMSPAAMTRSGGGKAHPNMQPYLTLSLCIALTGIFPSPN